MIIKNERSCPHGPADPFKKDTYYHGPQATWTARKNKGESMAGTI